MSIYSEIGKSRNWIISDIRTYCSSHNEELIDLGNFLSKKFNIQDYKTSSACAKYTEEVLFDHHDGYKAFALPIDILEKIDFTDIDFEGFKASGYDFSKLHNVNIDVEKVYNKDLSNSNLSGVDLFGDFSEVDLANADISNATIEESKLKLVLMRKKLMDELSRLEDGMHVMLQYNPMLIDYILFKYEDKGAYKEFALPKKYLKKIDFSNVDFKDFKASEYDFTGLYGVKIDPQTIYKKNLFASKLNGVEFIGPFKDVRIQSTDFTGSVGAQINPNELCYINTYAKHLKRVGRKVIRQIPIGLYGCKFNGVTFTDEFKSTKLSRIEKLSEVTGMYIEDIKESVIYRAFDIKDSDFTGSVGAIIHADSIYAGTGLKRCILKDATIEGDIFKYYEFDIEGADFRGAKVLLPDTFTNRLYGYDEYEKMILINPDKVKEGMNDCKFEGVYFTRPIKKDIHNSDFTGSKNAIINLKDLDSDFYKGTNFTDAKVIGLDGEYMIVSEDGRLTNKLDSMIDEILGLEHQNVLIGKQELENARAKLIEINRKKVQEKISELLRLVETTERLGVEPRHLYSSIPIGREELFVTIDDHYEINRNFVEYLRFLNLSMIDFDNVKVSGLDFRHSGARINPQLVYKKDLSNGIFDTSNIKFYDDFTGVNIEGADFSECEVDPKEKKKI